MSLDIRRVTPTPFKKLEKPRPSERWVSGKNVLAELVNRVLHWLILGSAFLLPASVWDFGGSAGSGRLFVMSAIMGLVLLLWLLSVLWLGSPLIVRRPFLSKMALVLSLLSLLSAIFGADPKASFGLVIISIFGFLFFALLINLPYPAGYFKKLLSSYLYGSTLAVLYIVIRFFFGGYDVLSYVVRDGWLFIGAVNIFILTSLSMAHKGWRRAFWIGALIPHFLILFLWDQAVPLLIVAIGSLAVAALRSIRAKKWWHSEMVYPLQVLVLAVLMLLVPIKFFTGSNPPSVSSYSYQDIGKILKEERLQNLVFGLGPGNAEVVLARTKVSFFDPDPIAGSSLFREELASSAKVEADWVGPAELNNGFVSILLTTGVLSSLVWLALIITWLVFAAGFYRRESESHPGAVAGASLVLFMLSLIFAPWSVASFLVLMMLASLTVALSPISPTAVAGAWSKRFEQAPLRARLWVRRGAGIGAIIIYLVVVIVSARVLLSGRYALAALATSAPGVAFNHWEKAEKLNPWNDIYRVKRAESRLGELSSATSLPEQKEIIESANAVFSKIGQNSPNPIAHWLSARQYAGMETYVEGSLVLSRQAYLKALELWPTNVALTTELARLYRYRMDALVGNDISASGLNQEIQDRLKYALKLAPDYLPARLELAFVAEKSDGIPAAVAELEPYEEESPEIKYHLGRLHFNDNKFEVAEEKFLEVLKEVPNHSNAHYSLGVIYFRRGKYRESLKEFEKVLEMNPGNEDVKGKIEEVKKKTE